MADGIRINWGDLVDALVHDPWEIRRHIHEMDAEQRWNEVNKQAMQIFSKPIKLNPAHEACAYCNSRNRVEASNCVSCGAPMGEVR